MGSAVESQRGSFVDQATVEGFDDVEVVIYVAADRSARWRVRYRYRLDGDGGTAAFQRARRNVSNPPGVFVERMREAARRAQRRTGRTMTVRNGTVAAYESVPHGRFGVVEYRFTWTGFAREDGGRVVAGDVIGGYPLGANESLVFVWSEPLAVADVAPSPNATRESTVRWDGPHEFGVERPRLVLTRAGDTGLTSTLTRPLVIASLGGVLAVVVAVAVAFRSGRGRGIVPLARGGDASASAETAETTETDAPADEPATGGGGSGGGDTPEALLSDEERVLGLLEDNGGRMKQQDVKEALGWSRTKTSNVVTDLKEEGKVEVYRLGRENTLALPGEMDV